MSSKGIPEYGIVIWMDAATVSGKHRKNLKKELVPVTSIGKLFLSKEGTLLIMHEYKDGQTYQRDLEGTVVPIGWVQEVISLTLPTSAPKPFPPIEKATQAPQMPEVPQH